MLVRTFIDERRRGWLEGPAGRRVTGVTGQPCPPPEDRALLRSALSKVPPRQQAVLVLRFLHDLPVEEVASLLGGTVKSQSARGLATLRRHLGSRARWAGGQIATTGGHS
jgi:DNA-directed RNA polymerase specialized sigma24 family protein